MILSALSVITMLVMLIAREFDLKGGSSDDSYVPLPSYPAPTPYKGSGEVARSHKSSAGHSSSIHIGHNDLSKLIRHLNGEFVYPPPSTSSQVHRRNKSSRVEGPDTYWTKKHDDDTHGRRSSATYLPPVSEEPHPKFVIE